MPPKLSQGHEQDATLLASSGSTPTKAATKPHITARVWCERKCATKRSKPIFSATPPLETQRILLCVACQEDVFRIEDPFLISIADMTQPHFHADAVRDVYIRVPDEDPKAKQPGVCGNLRQTTYGSLDAAQRWREHYAQVLEIGGFSRGRGISVSFFPHRLGDVHSGTRR